MIYLDNAATTFPKPDNVTKRILSAVTENYGTPGRGSHFSAQRAAGAVEKVRKDIARFFGVLEEFRVVFTYSATDALNMAIKGFLNDGDHVVISAIEHNSVSRPIKRMAVDGKITLDIAECDAKGYVNVNDLAKKVSSKTKLVIVSHASNVTGAVAPIDKIGEIARSNGAYFLLDAAQTAGRVPINIVRSKVDFLAMAGHKGLFGMQGTGVLVLGERVKHLRPFREGGTGFDSQSELQPVNWPEAFESGTHNVPGILSLGAGIEFINEVGLDKISHKESVLLKSLWDQLKMYDCVTLYGPAPDEERVSVLSFNIKGWDPKDVGDVLNQTHGIHVRAGLHCSPMAHALLGTFPEGAVRVSPGYFNSDKDIDSFLKAVGMIADIDVPLYG